MVQKLGQAIGNPLSLTPQTFRKRLGEKGLLITEPGRKTLTVRRTLEEKPRIVLCLRKTALYPQKKVAKVAIGQKGEGKPPDSTPGITTESHGANHEIGGNAHSSSEPDQFIQKGDGYLDN